MTAKQRGSSLIEAIIAIAVLGMAVGAATSYFAQSGTEVRVENAKEVQMMIATRVQNALANKEALNKTLTLTVQPALLSLRACKEGTGGATGCNTHVTAAAAREFDLVDAETKPDGSPIYLSGGTAGWDIEGNPCLAGSPMCIFGVKTKFWATCDPPSKAAGSVNPAPNCQQARYLNFKYLVTVKPPPPGKVGILGDFGKLNDYPNTAAYNGPSTMGSVRQSTAESNIAAGGACNTSKGLRSVGFDRNGKPICRCIDGREPPAGGGVCPSKSCKSGELMVGFKETSKMVNGVKETYLDPDCLSAKACENDTTFNAKCPCKIIDLAPSTWTPNAGDCGPGFWMVHVNYGECTATTDKDGKGAPETVKCTEHTAKCCKMDSK